jgi:hypothetical protein
MTRMGLYLEEMQGAKSKRSDFDHEIGETLVLVG